jgi:hypothetical protein
MAILLTVNWSIPLTATFLDAAANPAPLASQVVWVSSDNTVVSVLPDASGYGCTALALSQGTAQVTVTADVDPSSTASPITQFTDFVVVPSMPVKVNIGVGAATPPQAAT